MTTSAPVLAHICHFANGHIESKSINTLSDTLLSVKRNNIVKFDNNRSSTRTDISPCRHYKIQNGR